MFYRLLVAIGRPFVWLVFRPRVSGAANVPAGGVVVCPNHLSGFDTLAVAYALKSHRLRAMGKNQLFRRPLLGPFVRAMGAFPAHDEHGLRGGVAAASALAGAGEAVVIFPEGERRYGRTPAPKTGAARTALAAGVPIVPTAIRGTDGWRDRVHWRVTFGEPIALDPGEAPHEATRRMWERVRTLEVGS
jgi:1-acyl-sn-glycerol-3-phosphate acyltransferase